MCADLVLKYIVVKMMLNWLVGMSSVVQCGDKRYLAPKESLLKLGCWGEGIIAQKGVGGGQSESGRVKIGVYGLTPCGKTGIRLWKVTRLGSNGTRGGGVFGHLAPS